MLKSMSIHQKDRKGTINSNFVTSCLAFKGLIPTLSFLTHIVGISYMINESSFMSFFFFF